METLAMIDIYATKGVEYLLVIGFLLLLVAFWSYLTTPAVEAEAEVSHGWLYDIVEWFRVPPPEAPYYFHPGHTWVKVLSGDVVQVGLDDFAQKLVGKVNSLDLPREGTRLEQGEKGWALVVDSKKIDMLSPVDGEVVGVNNDVLTSPETMEQDPYEKGWLLKVKLSRPSALRNLLKGHVVKKWIEHSTDELRRLTGQDLGLVYQDGGLPVKGLARALDPDRWDEITRRFFLTS